MALRRRRTAPRLQPSLLATCAAAVAVYCTAQVVAAFVAQGGFSAAARGSRGARGLVARRAAIRVKNPPKEGDREIVDGPDGPIIVTKVDGAYFAVDATCPHLNLPMKKGNIEKGAEGPVLTCSFHNSCFNMKSGKCTKWVSGALGFENDFVSGIMGNLGGKQTDLTAYEVVDPGDGYIWLEKATAASS